LKIENLVFDNIDINLNKGLLKYDLYIWRDKVNSMEITDPEENEYFVIMVIIFGWISALFNFFFEAHVADAIRLVLMVSFQNSQS
jgi:hypothetical protein